MVTYRPTTAAHSPNAKSEGQVPQRGPGAEPRWVEVPKKMNNFTVIAGEFLRILGVTSISL